MPVAESVIKIGIDVPEPVGYLGQVGGPVALGIYDL